MEWEHICVTCHLPVEKIVTWVEEKKASHQDVVVQEETVSRCINPEMVGIDILQELSLCLAQK